MKRTISFILIVAIAIVSLMTVPISAATAYSQPKVTSIKSISNGVRLTWNRVNGAAKYRVFVKNGNHWKALGDTLSTTWTNKTVKNNTKYTYTVRCVSKDGKKFTSTYNSKGWSITYKSYSTARTVWNYLTSHGLSKANAAGIIGNMMMECGRSTLDLDWSARGCYYGDTFYGLCQWGLNYMPSWFDGCSVKKQLDYLMSDIKYQFDIYGGFYQKKFNYAKFKMLSVNDSAVAFAACYERPGYEYNNYQIRRQNAAKAYSYFMNY